MAHDGASVAQSLDRAVLTEVARQATGRSAVQVLDWRVTWLGGGVGNPVSVGLYRVEEVD